MPRTLDMPHARHLFFPAWGGLRRTRTREDHHGRKSSSLQFRGMSVALPRGGGTAPLRAQFSRGGPLVGFRVLDAFRLLLPTYTSTMRRRRLWVLDVFRLLLPTHTSTHRRLWFFDFSSGSPSRALSSSCVKTLLRACRTKTMTIRKKGKTTATCLIDFRA